MRRTLTALLLSALAAPVLAAAPGWTVDPAASELALTATFEKAPVPGRFRKFEVALSFDPERPGDGRLRVGIDIPSADFGNGDINKEIRGPDWFDVARFPRADFEAAELRRTGSGTFVAAGTLTVKGIARPLSVPFTWKPEAGGAVMAGEFVVPRADYRIGLGEWASTSSIGGDIKVRFNVRLRPGS